MVAEEQKAVEEREGPHAPPRASRCSDQLFTASPGESLVFSGGTETIPY